MVHSVFFSWQDDTPSGVGRRFLREVLDEACKETKEKSGVNEAERDESMQDELIVESDTEGEAGQPPVVDTILNKIDAAAVVVADITFTGSRLDGRPTPNANVLIEYGWALKSLKYRRVITVMNEAYGKATRESLPFDLSHMRLPIRFSLREDASREQKEEVRRQLVGVIKKAIRSSLSTLPSVPAQLIRQFPKAVTREAPARFRSSEEAIGFHDGLPFFRSGAASKEVYLSSGPAMWLRLMPTVPLERKWSTIEIKKHAQTPGISFTTLLNGSGGYDYVRAADGWGIYKASGEKDRDGTSIEIPSVAFVFETGEIWSIDTAWLSYSETVPFVESHFNLRLQEYAHFLKTLGASPPYHWIAGITGIKGRLLDLPVPKNHIRIGPGPLCVDDTIEMEGEFGEGQSTSEALRPFFEKIFEKCGVERPDYSQMEF